jgi:hypothetical protein
LTKLRQIKPPKGGFSIPDRMQISIKKHKKNLLVSFTYMQYEQEERQINLLIGQIKELAELYHLKVNKITGCIELICFDCLEVPIKNGWNNPEFKKELYLLILRMDGLFHTRDYYRSCHT